MRIVVHLSDYGWPVPAEALPGLLADVGGLVEDAGVDGLAVADHLWQHPVMGGPERATLEAYTTLAWLAAHTRTVRLFTLATGAHVRPPGLLAKTVTTLDVLAGGRVWLGIGAGHYQEECEGLGVPFPPTATRFDLLEDALEVCTRMWAGDQGEDGPYAGHHVRAARLLNVPQALARTGRSRPGILVAGTGERRTLPLVARYADACSLRPGPEIAHKLEVLRRACDEAGTDYDRIERTCAWSFAPDDGGPATAGLVEQLRGLAAAGIQTVIGRVEGDDPRPGLAHLGRHVVPAVADLEAG
jgi:alkanesulfonate monooxygenase SsuD/methylene tetrahydromethanopterin reductase-like flavin-dependent oxidoreductase (luciferase family)